ERLCSDIAIISQGKLLASGSLNELRKGIQVEGDGQQTGPISLEEYFIHIVGGERSTGEEEVLQWLTEIVVSSGNTSKTQGTKWRHYRREVRGYMCSIFTGAFRSK